MDPIGTVRREEHEGGYSIWVRQDPGYPDSEFAETEWTCIHSTAPGNIGCRTGNGIAEKSEIVDTVFGTPAYTGEDVEMNQLVRVTRPGPDQGRHGFVRAIAQDRKGERRVFDVIGEAPAPEPWTTCHTWLWRSEFELLDAGEE